MAFDIIPTQEGGKFKAVASGALPSGRPVIVNSDGTVSAVSADAITQEISTLQNITSTRSEGFDTVYDPVSEQIIMVYSDYDNNRVAIVALTVADTTVTFGSTNYFDSGGAASNVRIVRDEPSGNFIVIWTMSSILKGAIASVSGTSVSVGSSITLDGGVATNSKLALAYDTTNQTALAIWTEGNRVGRYGFLSISGTTLTLGSNGIFANSGVVAPQVGFDKSTGKYLIAYQNLSNSGYGTAISVDSSTASLSSAVVFSSSNATPGDVFYSERFSSLIVAFSSSFDPTLVVSDTSGTNPSFSGQTTLPTRVTSLDRVAQPRLCFNAVLDKLTVVYSYANDPAYYTDIVNFTVENSVFTFDSAILAVNVRAPLDSVVYDLGENRVFAVQKRNPNENGQYFVYRAQSSNLTEENFIGISSGGAVADTGNATVDIVGTINNELSGLNSGQNYFVQSNGSLSTTADTPQVLAGTAISATSLLVKG